ncbi:MAG: peptidoglycan-associated lipoprotein Pal [Deltaproteobacteria bacterium]|nr:peptidoglycan-associated lipoprotein Pal [Deltaproteobacteria bacterium]MCL5277673.1 peptidoglycan-associated lipoprotein Pal [Deltaproteobacteria bacterium]
MRKITLIIASLAILGFIGEGCAKKGVVKPAEQPQTPQVQQQQPAPEAVQQQTAEKSIEEIQKELEMIHFDFDKYNVRPDAKTTLEQDSKVLSDNPNIKVQIAGYCDERGSVEYNLALGEKRAKSAQDYLETLGIAPGRLSTISYGKSDPIDPGHNEKAWAMNRRDEFHIVQ